MQFNTLLFLLIYLPIFIFLMLFVKNNKVRNLIILVFSLLFYFLNDIKYFVLLLVVILLSYLFAIKVKKNKLLYTLYLVIVLGILAYFKYGSYVIESLKNMNILMPLGISYFLFESISYVSDCFYDKYEYSKNIFEVASYISFFPCISCGPINRFNKFTVYYKNEKIINDNTISEGFKMFVIGLAKKVIIADQIGPVANIIFSETTTLTTPLAWLGVIAAGIQIYYDFSGYSDMAIGIGKMIGFQIDKNFDYPFISKSWSEFWRRWHISLGTWFKDYVYIPLGGSRVSKPRFAINILIVWMLTGVWHGGTLNFILWGLLSGMIILIERFGQIKLNAILGIIVVNVMLLCSQVIFRINSLSRILFYFKNMFTWTGFAYSYYKLLGIMYLWPIFIVAILFIIPKTIEVIKKKTFVYNSFIVICLLLSIVYILGSTQQTFVYFGF